MSQKPSIVARFIARVAKAATPVEGTWRNHWRSILEPFPGAWQRNIEEKRGDILTYPTLYACLFRIASDFGKLPFSYRRREGGIWTAAPIPDSLAVLRRPNGYQTPAQFREYWMLSKLIKGNAYILKRRGEGGRVTDLYLLDPDRVLPMVSDSGAVFYQLQWDKLNGLPEGYPSENLIVPATEIIHDRCVALYHPLIGIPPIAAASWAAVKNLKIMRNATDFFANSAQPGGLLTAPAGMTEKAAEEVKKYWESTYAGGGGQYGKIAVIGSDLKFTPFAMKSIDAQMIEQLRYGDEQICQPFGIPPYKVGIGTLPSGLGVDGVNQLYYADALQAHIEHAEGLLTEGLEVQDPFSIELDLEPLLRMDEAKRAEVETKLVKGLIKKPDEGRARFNLAPTEGGDTLWGQNQDYPLGMLARREEWDQAMQPAAAPAPEADAPAAAPAAAAETGNLQQEALNGAQIASLLEIIQSVSARTLDPDAAKAMIRAAFPLIPVEDIDRMVDSALNTEPPAAEPAPSPAPAPAEGEEEALTPEQRAYLMAQIKAKYEHETT